MKLSVFCSHFFTNYRHFHLWKSKLLYFPSFHSIPVLRHYNRDLPRPVRNSIFSSVTFHSSVILNAKAYNQEENNYCHNVMENISSYNDTVLKFPLSANNSMPNSSKLAKEFIELSVIAQKRNIDLENSDFIPLITRLTNTMPELPDDDVIDVLHHLCLWPPSPRPYSLNFKRIWNTLDFQCMQRMKTWDLKRKLIVADYWFYLRLSRISSYNRNLIEHLLENLPLLTNQQTIQLMFYINLQRHVSRKYIYELEKKLFSVINTASLEEIGIICLGYFKTKSKIKNFDLITIIMKRLMAEIDQVNSITVSSILKFLRKSMNLSCIERYVPLLNKCVSYIPNVDIPTAVHLALLSSECHVYCPILLNAVTEKLANNIERARVKDCRKLIQCLSHFNYYPDSKFHNLFFEELKKDSRKAEMESYPRDIAYATLFYAYLGYFNYELLKKILDPNFVEYCKSKCPETFYVFTEIDYCIEIECKDYDGPRISKAELKQLEHRRGNMPNSFEVPNMHMRLLSYIVQALKDLSISEENILIRHILPHIFSPDIIVRLSGSSKSLSDRYGSLPSEYILVPPHDEIWACFVVAPVFAFAHNSKHVTGVTGMKLRQLKKLNYKTVFAPHFFIPESEPLRKKYVRRKLVELQKENNLKLHIRL